MSQESLQAPVEILPAEERPPRAQATTWWQKLLIGLFAGLCAAFFPRLAALLTNSHPDLSILPVAYLIVGGVFALFVACATLILTYQKMASFSDTFMAALGVPAIVAGAVNTISTVNTIGQAQSENQRLADALRQETGIRQTAPMQVTPLEASQLHSLLEGVMLINPAYAGPSIQVQQAAAPGWGIQREEPRYVILLEQASNREAALARARQLRTIVPDAEAVQSGSGNYFVVTNTPLRESEAVLQAYRLKTEKGLQPQLMPLK